MDTVIRMHSSESPRSSSTLARYIRAPIIGLVRWLIVVVPPLRHNHDWQDGTHRHRTESTGNIVHKRQLDSRSLPPCFAILIATHEIAFLCALSSRNRTGVLCTLVFNYD